MQNLNLVIHLFLLAGLIDLSTTDGNFTRWQFIRHKLSSIKTKNADNGTVNLSLGSDRVQSLINRASTDLCVEVFSEDGTCESFESCCGEACSYFRQNPKPQCSDGIGVAAKLICQCTSASASRRPRDPNDPDSDTDQSDGSDEPTTTPRPRRQPQVRIQCGIPIVSPSSNRIVGGEEAMPHSWPWQASIQYADHGHICGGSVIDNLRILTAAHCVENDPTESSYLVALGLHDRQSDDGQIISVDKITIHPRRNAASKSYDAAILHLSEPILFSDTVMPVCLPEKEAAAGIDCVTTGWGIINPRFKTAPRKLMQVQIPIQERSICSDTYGSLFDSSMLCAGDFSKGSCSGDSGGPLVCQVSKNAWALNGIVSYAAKGCTMNDDKPTVFARVMSVIDWIKQNK